MSTDTVRSPRTRPSPRQAGHGSVTIVPSPPHDGHGVTDTNCPNMLRVARRTSPAPPQVWQVDGRVPCAPPVPLQVSQRSRVFSLTFRLAPVATSRNATFTVTLMSCPRRGSPRGGPPRRGQDIRVTVKVAFR